MGASFLVGLLVSAVLWFVADWLAGLLFTDDLSRFVFTFAVAVTGGALVMLAWRVRALRSGLYGKARWGIRRK